MANSTGPTQFASIAPSVDVRSVLGKDADALLGYESKTISKSQLHLPGPDFIDRVVSQSDRTPTLLRNYQTILNTGRLAGTGFVSILPVDQHKNKPQHKHNTL